MSLAGPSTVVRLPHLARPRLCVPEEICFDSPTVDTCGMPRELGGSSYGAVSLFYLSFADLRCSLHHRQPKRWMTLPKAGRPKTGLRNCAIIAKKKVSIFCSEREFPLTAAVVGHIAFECKAARKVNRDHIDVMPGDVAWEQLLKAARSRDIDDIKEAVQKYAKAEPSATYHDLETAFRAQSLPVYLIAIEKGLVTTLTNMDLQGNLMRKYTVTYRFSDQPLRERDRPLWPSSAEDNLERLKNSGEVVPLGIPKCRNCDELGHIAKSCPQEKVELQSRNEIKCYNCEGVGHRVRDCMVQPSSSNGSPTNLTRSGAEERTGCLPQLQVSVPSSRDCSWVLHSNILQPAWPQGRGLYALPSRSLTRLHCTNRLFMKGTEPRDASGVECRKCGESLSSLPDPAQASVS